MELEESFNSRDNVFVLDGFLSFEGVVEHRLEIYKLHRVTRLTLHEPQVALKYPKTRRVVPLKHKTASHQSLICERAKDCDM